MQSLLITTVPHGPQKGELLAPLAHFIPLKIILFNEREETVCFRNGIWSLNEKKSLDTNWNKLNLKPANASHICVFNRKTFRFISSDRRPEPNQHWTSKIQHREVKKRNVGKLALHELKRSFDQIFLSVILRLPRKHTDTMERPFSFLIYWFGGKQVKMTEEITCVVRWNRHIVEELHLENTLDTEKGQLENCRWSLLH